MRRLVALVVTLLSLALVGPAVALAQDATPSPGVDRAAFVPSPEECTVEPREAASVAALATPTAATSAAIEEPEVPFGATDGEPADPETAAEVSAVIRESWACLNGEDYARFLALLTDREAAFALPPELLLQVAVGLSTPEAPAPDQQTAVFAILDVEQLPDGRVGAYVVVDTPFDPLPVEINYQIAAETAEGWRLDQFICFAAEGGLC